MHTFLNTIRKTIIPAILNSYSVLFFFNNRLLAIVLLVVTFFNFTAGLSGLIAVITTVAIASSMGFDRTRITQGIYSFNAILTGIGMGTFFEPGLVFFILLLLASLSSLIISVILSGWLGKYGLAISQYTFCHFFLADFIAVRSVCQSWTYTAQCVLDERDVCYRRKAVARFFPDN